MLTAVSSSCLFVVAQNPKLARVLRQLRDPSVTAIRASFSALNDADATALATALAGNTALTLLYLSSNQIGDAGASALAAALAGNTALKQLHLGSNQIGDAGAAALREAANGRPSFYLGV